MATFDLVLGAVILISALMGLFRGLFREVISLATWLVALLAALYLAPSVAERIAIVNNPTAGLVIAFIVVFGATLVVGSLVQWAVGRLVESTGLSGTDRLLGLLFGGARGAVVCIVGLIALKSFVAEEPWWRESVLQRELLAFEDDVLRLIGTARASVWQMASEAAGGESRVEQQ